MEIYVWEGRLSKVLTIGKKPPSWSDELSITVTLVDPFLTLSSLNDHLPKMPVAQPRRLGNAIVETQEGARAEVKKRERATRRGWRSCVGWPLQWYSHHGMSQEYLNELGRETVSKDTKSESKEKFT